MQNRAKILAITTFVSASILAFGFGRALAQEAPPTSEPPVTGTLSGNVNLSPEEMQKQANDSISRMEQTAVQVQRMLDKADQDGDAVKVDCLNDKLNIVDTRLRAGRERKQLMDGALRVKDAGQANVFLEVIQNHRREADKAHSQAQNCIGADIGFLGDTKTTTTIDPDIPNEPTEPPLILLPPNWGLELPPGTDPSASL